MAAKFGNKCKKACPGGGGDDDGGGSSDDDGGGRNNCRGGGGNDGRDVDDYGQSIAINLPRGW